MIRAHHVLLIEDNAQNRYLVRFLLEQSGMTVTEAVDGVSALERKDILEVDIVLLDIQLPRMDGYEVARRLRLRPEFATVPIVAVTSYAMPGDREKALEAGCTAYIEKPINPETFVAQVVDAMRQKPVKP